MFNWTFLLSRMKGCYLSRAKRELRAMNMWLLLSALVYWRRCLSTSTREQGSSKTHIFYAVEIDGDSNTASFLAKQHGMQFISKVKRVNIRQLIIETSMLHSPSRMTEQVMGSGKHPASPRPRGRGRAASPMSMGRMNKPAVLLAVAPTAEEETVSELFRSFSGPCAEAASNSSLSPKGVHVESKRDVTCGPSCLLPRNQSQPPPAAAHGAGMPSFPVHCQVPPPNKYDSNRAR
ncbi:PREDICTED: uncharacterized protein LOC106901556 isoform X3 [Calidris pugnax]|uniref:uncharacterized protein LOC106901556 isoform X3 n=1 Tax=Calidris pugnax TaxID=198806 RepID=UPI00071CBEC7|nr:PREDICTED: uncharacterized protein LOC106901556 isoform X3 [Calidris pugnax]